MLPAWPWLQATLQGVLTAGMFFFISHAQPLPELSRERPHPRVFSRYVFTSLLGQFGVYIAFLMAMQHMAHALMPKVRRRTLLSVTGTRPTA